MTEMCDTSFAHMNWYCGSGGGGRSDPDNLNINYKVLLNFEGFHGKAPTLKIIDDMMREEDTCMNKPSIYSSFSSQ